MKLHEYFDLEREQAKKIFDDIVEYWNSHPWEKAGMSLEYVLKKYKNKKLKYALVYIGYAFCLNSISDQK